MAQADPPRLSPQQQRCVSLLLEGMGDDEIAAVLGISSATVKHHINRARIALGGEGAGHRWWIKMAHALGYTRGGAAAKSRNHHSV